MPKYDESTHIVYLDLPEETAEKLDEVRDFVGSAGVKRWVAHVTLKQDVDYLVDTDKISAIVEKFVRDVSPVRLSLTEFLLKKETDGVSWNIYVGIKERELLHDLTKTISKLLMPLAVAEQDGEVWEQTDDYYPHISIISGKGWDEGQKILEKLKGLYNVKEEIVCKSITLARWDVVKWTRAAVFDLIKN